jgi:hypothetical protein
VYDDSVFPGPIMRALMDNAARSTLPFQEALTNRHHGTAFWYNHLIEDTPDREVFRQYLVTASALTGFGAVHWTLRPELCRPRMTAENLLVTGFAEEWTHLSDLGVAIMPAGSMHGHARHKGWQWHTQEITEGLAALPEDLATIGSDPVPALVLGHDVGPENHERRQLGAVGALYREDDGRLRWDSRMPQGCVGAPLFVGIVQPDGQSTLVCAGVVLPGEGGNEIAPFDRIRSAVAAVAPPAKPRKTTARPLDEVSGRAVWRE